MTYGEALRFLKSLARFGARFGLDRTSKLAALAGNPHHSLTFIHVAGTNGKGSTCAMLESIYRASGLRVGLFTSPHLVSFCERIQTDRQPISREQVAALTGELASHLPAFEAGDSPTLFEFVVGLGLLHFLRTKCDLVIWETGLGGRLDATNIVTPLASVITNIGFDHEAWLGETLAQIAAEKAGIIKPGVPIITGSQAPDAIQVIAATAARLNAPLTQISADAASRPPLDRMVLPLPGAHQKHNAAVALEVTRVLGASLPLDDACRERGLLEASWLGRLQRIQRDRQTLYLDGAHNLDSARALAEFWKGLDDARRAGLILGVLRDKDWEGIARLLAPLATRIWTVPVPGPRSCNPESLAAICREANPAAEVAASGSLQQALESATRDPLVVITGSLYLVGEALPILGILPDAGPEESVLNDWSDRSKGPK